MSAALFLRGVPLLRRHLSHRHHFNAVAIFTSLRRPLCSSAAESTPPATAAVKKSGDVLVVREPHRLFDRISDADYGKWKVKEEEILRDIEPITLLVKEILHSDRYKECERLTSEDEKTVVEKLLAYHPHSEDKIGCGLDSIMVDRHPLFKHSRCLFVIRTDGGWIDFSYQKCLRGYIRNKYPSHAERYIREHLKRS